MKNKPKVTCIIPFYNEGERIYNVLHEVSKVSNLHEIICVDDCSEEDESEKIKALFPAVKLIRLPENLGKSGAIEAGILQTDAEFILMLDADLRFLRSDEIENSVRAVQKNDGIDMIILRRINAVFLGKSFFRTELLLSGERIVRKKDLLKVLANGVKGWQIEVALNTYMLEPNKQAYWMRSSARNTRKPYKWGLFEALILELRTGIDIVTGTSIFNLIKQWRYLALQELQVKNN